MISDDERRQIASLARNPRRRAAGPRTGLGTRWHPYAVTNPESGLSFTETSAWDLVAELIEAGHPVEEMTLEQPAGARGLVLHVDLAAAPKTLYIKLQLGGHGLFCRSFHYSDRPDRYGTPWPKGKG